EWAMPDFIVDFEYYGNPDDMYFQYQWNFSQTNDCDIDAPEAWDISTGSSDITVAVFDDGVEVHPDLPSDRIVEGYDAVKLLPSSDDKAHVEPYKNEAHGMACAGLIAATHNSDGVAGLAPNCKIMPIQNSGSDGAITSLDNIAAGFDYAREHGADIISNSWGGKHDINDPPFVSLREAIENAMTLGRDGKGCVVLFASGNDSENYVKNTMATIDGVIAVGATDQDDFKTDYSNYGEELDVVAPSADLLPELIDRITCIERGKLIVEIVKSRGNTWTTDIESSGGYNKSIDWCPDPHTRYIQNELDEAGDYTGHFGGTSASCPQVAGLAALILSVNDNLVYNQSEKLHQVEKIIRQSADKVHSNFYDYNWSQQNPGHSKKVGYGRVNAYEALKYTLENYGVTIDGGTIGGIGNTFVFTEDITIKNNSTLTILPGTNIQFADDISLIVNGSLDAVGTSSDNIVFSTANSQWQSIKIYGDANIDNCLIKNAHRGVSFYDQATGTVSNSTIRHNAYGIYANQSTPNIQNCIIRNNSHSGIDLWQTNDVQGSRTQIIGNEIYNNDDQGIWLYKSSPDIRDNTIHDNNVSGISGFISCSPRLGNLDYRGYNHIYDHSFSNLEFYVDCNPDLGQYSCTTHGGYNQITGNSYHIWAETDCFVMAQINYWEPYETIRFYAHDGSTIDYSHPLSSPVFGGALARVSPETAVYDSTFGSSEASSESRSVEMMDYYDPQWSIRYKLLFARNLIYLDGNTDAQTICKEIIEHNPDSTLSFFALDILWEACRHEEAKAGYDLKAFKSYLNDLAKKKDKKEIYGYARLLSAASDEETLIASTDAVYDAYTGTFLQETALFQKFMYYFHELNDISMAEQTAARLESEFPKSPSTHKANAYLDSHSGTLAADAQKNNVQQQETDERPLQFGLSANYPNPFNPSTRIEFALPELSDVRIDIFNTLGQRIKSYTLHNQPAGRNTLTWAGTNAAGIDVPSGLYILKFYAQSKENKSNVFNQSVKMLLLR
ncbi:MAG: S8 family serine peptidase, partial [Caldithrix sp.]|nr:S8 family serine peptidase [Caldithrix sp.]